MDMEDFESKYNDVQLERMLNENANKNRVSNKSIGKNKVTSYSKKKQSKKLLGKNGKIILTIALLVIMGINAPKAIRTVRYASDLNKATKIVTEQANDNLENANLVDVDDKGNVTIKDGGNSISDYGRLNLCDPSIAEIYAYDKALDGAGDTINTEFEKLIEATSYKDGMYNYTSLAQYYTVNGLVDKDGKPSGAEFKKYAEEQLVKSYRDGTIDDIMKKVVNESRGK